MQYRPGMFSEVSIRNGMKEWIESRFDRCDNPSIYNELPHEVKDVLDAWIFANILPGKRTSTRRSVYGLKTDFQRATGIYLYSGAFAGAMVKAGYRPMNPSNPSGRFNVITNKNGVG
ncbi:hypothetical protein [Desulfosporosinus lacus]|uniref:Uncharacterized protein n=1 Tax=Desulfosporosinus lacus DSM 15449 TaxID=1121420 RepID=A0A1M5WIF9_9FIRM|nr:hypothetical protein [Desulfosporosinus lacus]SHH87003.1 hypothetical protein SAMN02746098_01623 [Desulfosporosinus lacus DSM 15449]